MSDPSTNWLVMSWRRWRRLPGGRWLFSRVLGRRVPYSGTIRASVDELAPGYAKVRMSDRKGLRNHYRSLHALALANLGELTSGLAMTAALPAHARGIPIRISVEYLKKARGEIVAESHCTAPEGRERQEHEVEAVLTDQEGDKVARFLAIWMVDPKP